MTNPNLAYGLEQEVALKEGETIADRKGRVKLYYAIYNEPEPKPKEEKKRWKVEESTLWGVVGKK